MNETKKCSRVGFWISTSLAIFFFLCCIVFLSSIAGLLMVKGTMTYVEEIEDKSLTEVVLEGAGTSKIAVIPVNGIITAQSTRKFLYDMPSIVERLKKQFKQASKDDAVKAVVLEIDSPGGGITASDIIYKEILDFKEETGKKVIVSMQDVAASGAYYISVAADKIISHPTTITGSIGVIMPLINIATLVEKYGIEDNSITSGKMKDIGSPMKKMSEEQRNLLLAIVNELYGGFIEVISKGRGMSVEDVRKLADGRIYTGVQALEAGLIDQLGYTEDAIAMAKEMAGLKEAKIIRYKRVLTLSEIFAAGINRLPAGNTIKIDLNRTAIDGDTPRFMYLWTGYQ